MVNECEAGVEYIHIHNAHTAHIQCITSLRIVRAHVEVLPENFWIYCRKVYITYYLLYLSGEQM